MLSLSHILLLASPWDEKRQFFSNTRRSLNKIPVVWHRGQTWQLYSAGVLRLLAKLTAAKTLIGLPLGWHAKAPALQTWVTMVRWKDFGVYAKMHCSRQCSTYGYLASLCSWTICWRLSFSSPPTDSWSVIITCELKSARFLSIIVIFEHSPFRDSWFKTHLMIRFHPLNPTAMEFQITGQSGHCMYPVTGKGRWKPRLKQSPLVPAIRMIRQLFRDRIANLKMRERLWKMRYKQHLKFIQHNFKDIIDWQQKLPRVSQLSWLLGYYDLVWVRRWTLQMCVCNLEI